MREKGEKQDQEENDKENEEEEDDDERDRMLSALKTAVGFLAVPLLMMFIFGGFGSGSSGSGSGSGGEEHSTSALSRCLCEQKFYRHCFRDIAIILKCFLLGQDRHLGKQVLRSSGQTSIRTCCSRERCRRSSFMPVSTGWHL